MLRLAVLAALLVTVPPAAAQSRTAGPVTEWSVPWATSRPRDPAVAPDGRIWFVGQVGNYVARLDPASGTFERFEVDEGTNPHNVIVDPAGNAWYSGNANGMIGRIDAKTGAIRRFPMPEAGARDPHTLVFDQNGDLWFTVQNGNFVGKLTVASGAVTLIPMPTPRSRPYGIVIDATGRPWFDLFGTNKIGTIDPERLEVREYQLPDARSRPRRIALTADGAVWYGDYTLGLLGRLDPKSGAVKTWALPSGRTSLPYAMTVDDAGRLWLAETGVRPNRLVGFDPKAERFLDPVSIPSGGGTIRHMVFDPKTQLIWFGTDLNTIGRADLTKLGKPVT
ncbi:MAG: lyase [Gemmatimonadales bacterium]